MAQTVKLCSQMMKAIVTVLVSLSVDDLKKITITSNYTLVQVLRKSMGFEVMGIN